MTFETILFDIRDGVARLTLNRPEKLNSFNVQMHLELQQAFEQLEQEKELRVLVFTGAGRAFCAGQDLSDRVIEKDLDLGASIEKFYAPLVRRIRALPAPVVAAVNGVAAGAGANLALACDIVIAARSASFIESFCKLGLIPDTGGTYFLPRLVGTARAMGMALLGDKIAAEQAANWGLIWQVVDDSEFASAIDNLINQLRCGPTKGLANIKRAMYLSLQHALDQQLNLERDFMRELGRTQDFREGVNAFLEKRLPKFSGH
jgi:2-(1,2-epoxy-1,2-dihydrophenyl)acetyl-CoA isomerase